MIHHDAMQERNDKVTELERFILDNGGIATYKANPITGKVEEAEEYRDVPVRLRGGTPADIMAQNAADAGILPAGASGDDLREAIKRFQKRGAVPRIQDFYADARRELENEYQQYGPPSRRPQRNFGTPEPQPFESRGEYNAGQPEKPIEAAGSREALKVGPARAVFRGWQDRAPYDTPVPIYNILGDHKQFGSTVGPSTLKSLGLEIPPTPTFEEWKAGGSRVQETPRAFSDALALASPSGRMSKRSLTAAQERIRQELFGKNGLVLPATPQPSEVEYLRRKARELRDLANRGMNPRAYAKKAQEYEGLAAQIEGGDTGGSKVQEPRAGYGTESPIFYSQLQRTIQEKMPNTAPAAMVKNLLDPSKGNVKAEEVEWSGINDFLAGKEKVTKAEVLDFLKSNEVQMKEVVKGQAREKFDKLPDGVTIRKDTSTGEWFMDVKNEYPAPDEKAVISTYLNKGRIGTLEEQKANTLSQALDVYNHQFTTKEPTKFSQYQTPGGDNYREFLLTLPVKNKKFKVTSVGGPIARLPEHVDFNTRKEAEIEIKRRKANKEGEFHNIMEYSPNAFQSSHFDEPNILAHVRMNDRTTADGNKVLFLEEVQSDWMQKGRDQGFGNQIHISGVRNGIGFSEDVENMEVAKARSAELSKEPGVTVESLSSKTGVPDAPFKKSWHELALKRMLRYAVDNGYDGIAWTTGEMQAERYDLSRQIEDIEVVPRTDAETGERTREVSIVLKGNRMPAQIDLGVDKNGVVDNATQGNLQGKPLADVVGKDLAKRIMESDKQTLSGIDLKLGGEGMKGFYDQIIPAFLNKYTKKWGGRVGETVISTRVTDEYQVVDRRGNILMATEDKGRAEQSAMRENRRDPGANAHVVFQKNGKTVHSFEITPAMRGSVAQGQPLFEKRGEYGEGRIAETQMGLFGGGEPAKAVTKKPKPVPEGQGTLFGGRAQPKFEVPKSALTPEQIAQQTPAVQQLLATPEGKHQVPQKTLPEAIQESVVIKDLREIGQLATDNLNIQGPEDIAALVHILREMDVEKLLTVSLDANNKPMFVQMVAMGVLDSAITTPRDALKGAYAMGAKKVILIHNHPSLDPEPSPQDVTLTRLMVRHARAVGMEIPYHLVIDDDKFGYIHGEEDGVKYSGDVEIRPMRAIGKLEAGFVPIREGRQVGIGKRPDALSNPQMAAKYARTLVSSKSAQVGIALDAKNHPVGVWHIGEKWPESPNVLGKLVGKMILRNNAAGIILSADQLPAGSYLRELQASIRSWGATLLDVVAWDGETVKSARQKGTVSGTPFTDTANMAEGETQYPYSTPGAKDFAVAEDESPYNAGGGGGDKPPARPTATGSPADEPSGQPIEPTRKAPVDDTTEEAFYTDEPALPADMGTGAFSRFIEVGKNSNKFPPPEMKDALLDPEGKFHDLGFWDEGELSALNPIRAAEIMDGKRYGLMKRLMLFPLQDGDKAYQWELQEENKAINEIEKGMSQSDKRTAFDVIEQTGSSTGPLVDRAVSFLKDRYDTVLDRLNAVRAAIGKDPIKKRLHYVTHFQELTILQDIIRNFGFRVGNASVTDITDVPASMLSISDFTKANSPYFKFAKQRIGELTERDAIKAYRLYIEPALRSIHMSRATKNARDILEFKVKIKSEYEGAKPTDVSLFGIRYPRAYTYFTRYLNRLTGKRDKLDKFFPGLAFVAGFTNRIFSAGSIAGNIGTVFTQFASFRNTAAETGPWSLKGQALILTPKWNKFYKTNSRIAMGRSYEPSYKNERYIGSKMVSNALDKFSQMASIPVSMTDNLMVGGAFLSGYFQAKGMGYTEDESIRHGDDVAERTQASANLVDRPPANQGKIKTMMGQFQTFIFNEYSQWKYDFLKQAFKGEQTYQGYGKGLGGMKQGKGRGYERFMYYVLGTLALGAIYDALGLPNPFRQEGATIPGGTDNSGPSKVWQHVVNQIPYISSVRFGGSPAVKGVLQGLAYIQGNEQQKRAALRKLASVGVRVFPMGGQISKTAGAWRLAVNEQDTWKAFKLLAFGKYQAKQNEGKPDGKTRTVRTRTVSARGVRARTVRTRVAR
jgi:DNA repair protein RadC